MLETLLQIKQLFMVLWYYVAALTMGKYFLNRDFIGDD